MRTTLTNNLVARVTKGMLVILTSILFLLIFPWKFSANKENQAENGQVFKTGSLLSSIQKEAPILSSQFSSTPKTSSAIVSQSLPEKEKDRKSYEVNEMLDKLPLTYVENKGQWDNSILYNTATSEMSVNLMKNGISYGIESGEGDEYRQLIWNLYFEGISDDASIAAEGSSAMMRNYFLGDDKNNAFNQAKQAREYKEVLYKNVYKDVDVRFYSASSQDDQLKYDYILNPGADIASIKMKYEGISKLSILKNGALNVSNPWGEMKETIPSSYQVIDGKKNAVIVKYKLLSTTSYGFEVSGTYNKNYPLVIDPVVLKWSTFAGGNGGYHQYGRFWDLVVDLQGNTYAVGRYGATFPTTAGSMQPAISSGQGSHDCILLKLNTAGSAPVWASYLGGTAEDEACGVALNAANEVYVTGFTASANFPVVAGSYNTTKPAGNCAFVVKINTAGSALLYSTFLGPNSGGRSVKATPADEAVVVGFAATGHPVSGGVFQGAVAGGTDGFVTKLNSAGSAIVFSTYIGGGGGDTCNRVRLDVAGNIFITGTTSSTNFPTSAGAYRTANAGTSDAFVTKMTPAGTGLTYSSYIGGSGGDEGNGIDVNAAGEAFVVGRTRSANFPTASAYKAAIGGASDAFITRFNAAGTGVIYSTYLGGTAEDAGFAIRVTCKDEAWVSGYSQWQSNTGDKNFPVTACGLRENISGSFSGSPWPATYFTTKFTPNGTTLMYSGIKKGDCRRTAMDLWMVDCCVRAVNVGSGKMHKLDNYVTVPGSWITVDPRPTKVEIPILYSLQPQNTIDFTSTLTCKTVTIIGTITDPCWGPPDPTITWNFGDGTTGSGDTVVHTYTTAGTYTVKMVSNCPPDSLSKVVTVTANSCGPSVTATGSSICPGACGTVTASGADGLPNYTYTWSPGGLSGAGPHTVCPSVTSTYTVTITDANNQTASATAVVTVLPVPTVTAGGTNICPGGTTTLTASGANSYTWQSGTTPITGTPVTATPAGNTTYTVTGTSAQGCTNSTMVAVVVNPLPVIDVASIALCKDSTGTLTATGANTYTWMPGNTNGATRNVTPTSTGVTTYTITGTSALGCTSNTTATVTANDCSKPNVTLTGGPICLGSCFTLQANATGLPPLSFTWTPNLGSTAGPFTVCPTTTTTYSVIVSDQSGNSDTAWAIVVVNPPPTVTSTSGTICMNSSVNLSAGGATTYTWAPATGLHPVTGPNVTANPTATTTYTVTGTDVNGCTNTSISTVNINPLPILTTTPGVICSGYAGTVYASGAVLYTWQPGGANGPSLTVTPTVTTTYTVSGTDANGCINTSIAVINVVTTPMVTVNSPVICEGTTATLTANGTTAYTWLPGNTTANPLTVTPLSTTSYTVIGSIGAGCSNSAVSVVTVNPLPTITSTSGVICAGASTNLTAGGGTNYTWTPGTGLNSTSGPGVTASPNTSTTYTITGIDANGCLNTSLSTVTVNPLPTISSNGGTICLGESVSLNASGATTYAWQPGGGSGSIITVTPAVTTTYTVTGTDANGCVNTVTTVVVVNPIPTITASGGTICNGSSKQLSASGAASYTWLPSGFVGANYSANPSVNTTYTVIGSTAGGCTNVTTTSVNVEPIPIVNFEPDTSGCVPLNVPFRNYTISTLGSSCYWIFGDGSTSTNCMPSHIYTKPGSYGVTLIVTSPNGCKDTLIRPGIINAYPLPKAGFTANPWETDIMEPRIKFYNQSQGDDSLRIWCFGDGYCDSSNIMDPIHTYEDTGKYNVCLNVVNRYGCTDVVCHDVIIKPIWTFYIPNAFTPNGDGNNETFNGKGYNIHDYQILVFDRWGNLIFESNSLYLDWDGRANNGSNIAQEDVYVWMVSFKDIFNKHHKLVGHVTLVK